LLNLGGAAVVGLSVLRVAGPTYSFQSSATGTVIPWLDQLEPHPNPEVLFSQIAWEDLDSWLTSNDQFFTNKHFDEPILIEQDWRLELSGLVTHPMSLPLADLNARARQELTFTMECSGNSSAPFFLGGVSNATWAGTSLSALLDEADAGDTRGCCANVRLRHWSFRNEQ